MIKIYTDGSAHPNPGPGGYGVVVTDGKDKIIECFSEQFEGPVTNNQMEIKAILWAMHKYGKQFPAVDVFCDSAYCVNTFTKWMYSWAKDNWRKSDKKRPENYLLVKEYYDLEQSGYKINLLKVRGHSGEKWNEVADELATGKVTPEVARLFYSK